MALHVDVVQNEWLSGYQERVARVRLHGGAVEVDATDPKWREVILRPLDDLDPSDDPDRFFRELSERLHGSHLFATQPHHEKDCKFRQAERIPAKRRRVRRRDRAPA